MKLATLSLVIIAYACAPATPPEHPVLPWKCPPELGSEREACKERRAVYMQERDQAEVRAQAADDEERRERLQSAGMIFAQSVRRAGNPNAPPYCETRCWANGARCKTVCY